jgi:hypothetical protein
MLGTRRSLAIPAGLLALQEVNVSGCHLALDWLRRAGPAKSPLKDSARYLPEGMTNLDETMFMAAVS